MNEHYNASVDGLLLFRRLASPSHSINVLWLRSVLDALSNVQANQFCMVNKSRDFNIGCSGWWGKGCNTSVTTAPVAKVTSSKYLSSLLSWSLEFTSWATHVQVSQKWYVSAKSVLEAWQGLRSRSRALAGPRAAEARHLLQAELLQAGRKKIKKNQLNRQLGRFYFPALGANPPDPCKPCLRARGTGCNEWRWHSSSTLSCSDHHETAKIRAHKQSSFIQLQKKCKSAQQQQKTQDFSGAIMVPTNTNSASVSQFILLWKFLRHA